DVCSSDLKHTDTWGEELIRLPTAGADSFWGIGNRHDGEDNDHQEFQGDDDAKYLGREIDVVHAQDANDEPSHDAKQPPGKLNSGQCCQSIGRGEPEESIKANLHEVIRNERQNSARDSLAQSQATRNEDVESPG